MAKSSRQLNSDELGELGQSEFAQLCAASQLITNPATRDRTGWDYRVEFPLNSLVNDVPLDSRSTPPAVMVQVKTVWAENPKITLNFRTLERLAKLSEPAVIIILEYAPDKKLHAIYGIHLLENALSAILKKLTKLNEKHAIIPSSTTISFSKTKYWKSVGKESNDLLLFFQKEVIAGKTIEDYAALKNKELKTLGYLEGSHTATFTFKAQSKNEVHDIFLGEKEAVVSDFKLFNERYGVKRKILIPKADKYTITITPSVATQCIVQFFADENHTPTVITGEFIPSALRTNELKEGSFKIEFELFKLIVKNTDDFSFRTNHLPDDKHNISHWLRMFEIFNIILGARFVFKVLSADHKTIFSAKIDDSPNTKPHSRRDNSYVLKTIKYLSQILHLSGSQNIKFSISEIDDASKNIRMCHHLLCCKQSPFSANFTSDESLSEAIRKTSNKGAIAKQFTIGEQHFAYIAYADVQFELIGHETIAAKFRTQAHGIIEIICPSEFSQFVSKHSANDALFCLAHET